MVLCYSSRVQRKQAKYADIKLNCIINIARELSFPFNAWEEHGKWAKKPGEECDV